MQGLVQAFGFCYAVHSSYYPRAMAWLSFVMYMRGPGLNTAASVRISAHPGPISGFFGVVSKGFCCGAATLGA
jgi:hypothetical protein